MKLSNITFAIIAITVSVLTTSCDSQLTSKEEENKKTTEQVKKPSMDIHAAVFIGNEKALMEHISYGSDLNAKDAYGSTPLNIACTFGKTDLALHLIKAGADINVLNADGGTALHTAAFFCRTEIVKALIDAKAKQDIRNQYGATALESVLGPWEEVEPIYKQLGKDLGALGLRLDFDRIKSTRPIVADLLSK